MGEKVLGWFEKIIIGEKRRWFFAVLIIIAILGIIFFPYVDANFLYYNRIEKRIDNLSNIVNLSNIPFEKNEILYEEYLSILEEMKIAREKSLFGTSEIEDSKADRMWKFSGGALLWGIIAIILVFLRKRKNTVRSNNGLINFFQQLYV